MLKADMECPPPEETAARVVGKEVDVSKFT